MFNQCHNGQFIMQDWYMHMQWLIQGGYLAKKMSMVYIVMVYG